MLPSGHRNLGKEKTSDRMSRGMTASLDLVLISNTYFVCVCERNKNISKPDPKGRKRQVSPKLHQK